MLILLNSFSSSLPRKKVKKIIYTIVKKINTLRYLELVYIFIGHGSIKISEIIHFKFHRTDLILLLY